MYKLRIAVAAISAACILAILPACGSGSAPAASSSSASTSNLHELTANNVKQAMDPDSVCIIQGSTESDQTDSDSSVTEDPEAADTFTPDAENDSAKTETGSKSTANTGSGTSIGNSNTGSKNVGSTINTGTANKNIGAVGGTTNTNTTTDGSSKSEHTHSWQPVYETVHHDEVGHTETVTVKDAYDEPIYEEREVCSACGKTLAPGADTDLHILDDHNGQASYSVQNVQVGTKHHDAVTEQKYVVDQAAYDEQVISGYQCSCGATK